MNFNLYFLFVNLLLFSFCLCDLSVGQKEKLLDGFINYYNNLSNRAYTCHEGFLQNTQQVNDNTYQVVANIKVTELSNADVTKTLQCTATVQDLETGVSVTSNVCQEPGEWSPEASQDQTTQAQVEVTEPTIERKPVQLDNEVQDTVITSGEQFIAVPRDQPSTPCVGCASHVNPQAAGVPELADLGVRHLDIHEPSVKHSLDTVLDVERQVQVVNGVRYVLTMSINFNKCSEQASEDCTSSSICKVTILVKPWVKLFSGGNYRAILSNNCTEEWQYGDNGEVVPELPTTADHNDTYGSDDDIQVKHSTNVDAQPNREKTLTDEEIKNIQEQIIPNHQFQEITDHKQDSNPSPDTDVSKQHVFKVESDKHSKNSIPGNVALNTEQPPININSDKRKAIEDLLAYFDFAGLKPKTESDEAIPRVRRSYDYDLQVLTLAEDYHGIKKSIENARFMHDMAEAMVDYLNEMDMEIKNRAVKDVVRAEEEIDNLQRFVYIQARVIIPCDKVGCEPRDEIIQICNGVIDGTNQNSPQILNTFCYNDYKERDYRDVIKEISLDDPVLQRLAKEAMKKIETESTSEYAMKLNKIVSANTQVTSGTLTKFSIIIDYIKCNKSVPLLLRVNCTVLEYLGSKICEVIYHERHWLKERKISYTCTDRPVDVRISKSKSITKNITVDDPKVIEMLQEAVQYLETQSNKNNKQKIVNIKSISSQIVAGFLIKIEFVVGYTNCTDENYPRDEINKCQLIMSEGLRLCKAQIWDRSWIIDGRQVEVSCDDIAKTNEIEKKRKKRSIDFKRGQVQQNVNCSNLEYLTLANESLEKFLQSTSSVQHYKVVKVNEAAIQDVAGKFIRIEFSISPTNCHIGSDGLLSSSKCHIVNYKNLFRCRSKILENGWLDKKQYFVNCNTKEQEQQTNTHSNELKEHNPSDLKYHQLAEESMKKYLHDTGNSVYHRIVRVQRVTTQIVSGLLTSIDFIISKMNETDSGNNTIPCRSKILEKHWLGTKDFNVTCKMQENSIFSDIIDLKPDDPKYMQIAVESLQKFIKNKPDSHLVRVTFVDKVIQVGEMTKIRFLASHTEGDDGDTFCHADYTEQGLLRSDIEVKCHLIGTVLRKTEVSEDDPKYYKYVHLADESLHHYLQSINSSKLYTIINIENITIQWEDGIKTLIRFIASPIDLDSSEMKGKRCLSQIREQPWLHTKHIDIKCEVDKELYRTKRQTPGARKEKDPTNPEYKKLAEESLQKYVQESGITQSLKVAQVVKVSTQVVAGTLTRIEFVVSSKRDTTTKCSAEVWEKPWMNFKDIKVSCQNDNHRAKRAPGLPGGLEEKDPTNPEYKKLAEESLQKYVQESGVTQSLKVAQVLKVSTQVVAGTLTRIEFVVSSKRDTTTKCNAEVWEKPWMNFKDIKVSCQNDNHRAKRDIRMTGGLVVQDPTDPKYKKLAEKSLQQYLANSGNQNPYKLVNIFNVTSQLVAGLKTLIDFTVAPTEDLSSVIYCHSNIWEQEWLNKTEIDVKCHIINETTRKKRELTHGIINKNDQLLPNHSRGHSNEEQNPNQNKYKLLAEESLRKYQKKSTIYHKVIEVKRVLKRVISGFKYDIEFSAAPTDCSVNVTEVNAQKCKKIDDVVLYCHSEIWDRPWLKQKKIDIECYGPDDNDFEDYGSDDSVDFTFKYSDQKNSNEKKYKLLAEEATEKYMTTSKRKYVHQVTEIHSVSENIADGTITKIEYSLSPTTCLRNEIRKSNHTCKIKKPIVVYHCNAKIWDRPWMHLEKDIKVTCKKGGNLKSVKRKRDLGVRTVRQIGDDDDEIDEDTVYYYADRAVQHVNDQSQSNNLHKLITIHAVQNSMQMNTLMIKMYIEIAETFCLRHHREMNLHDCEEMDGLNHRLCFVRLWPSPDDELIVRHVSVVCDDDDDFKSVSGVNIPELVRMSIVDLERSPDVAYKLVHQGEPQIIPSLDSKVPFKINFIIGTTNCSKDVNLHDNPFQCYINTAIPSKSCHSFIWLKAETKFIRYINAKCTPVPRSRRSLSDPTNVALDNLEIQKLVSASLEKLEMSSLYRYKQRVLQINSHSTKITSGKVTTIDFDVGYTSCLKYEWVENITSCDFLEHLPRRRCVAQIWERLWINNGQNIDVNCVDDETPLESHIEFESAEMANELAREALKHIEAKYPHPSKQKVVRIFSLEKQVVAGIHYRMKVEVGLTDCVALSEQTDCKLLENLGLNKFCRVNVWVRPWTDHPPNFRVSCDFQEGTSRDFYHHVQAEHLFYNFLTTYNPSYANDYSQMQKRFEIFKTNIKKIHEFNIHEKGTATYGVTRFTDLTYEEFSSTYMGLNTNLRDANQIPMKKADVPDIKIPQNFDWREYEAVTEVKDQGSCGSCWAFSVTGNIEGQWKMQSGQLVSLSEQELVDCDKLDQGCNGGLPDNAYRAIEQMGGLELESDYPYEAVDDKCAFNKTLAKVQISGAVNITTNETGMAQWLVHNGPISIGINANAMQFYMGGISHPWKPLCNPSNLDHGVLIVGYGIKDYPLFHKKLPYWIVKNSWGKSWGEQGYYRVYRGDGTCGVNQMASSAVI